MSQSDRHFMEVVGVLIKVINQYMVSWQKLYIHFKASKGKMLEMSKLSSKFVLNPPISNRNM